MMGGNSGNPEEGSEIEDSDENEFNFIKSNDSDDNFFYNGNWLLYGGILLIAVSITGMIITLKPKKRKNRKTNRR